ncbi:MAG: hypothetical protein ACKN9P_00070, partial [Phenylobacterium sp.]
MSHPAEDRPEADAPEPDPTQAQAEGQTPAGAGPAEAPFEPPPVEPPPVVAAPIFAAPPPRRRPARAPSDAPVWMAAAFVSILWALAPIAFALGYRQGKSPFDHDPFVLLILAAMAIGPAGLVWVAASLFVEGRRLRRESQRAARLADEMVAPAVAAGISAGEIATGLQSEVARAGEAAERMARQLEGLRAAMEAEA